MLQKQQFFPFHRERIAIVYWVMALIHFLTEEHLFQRDATGTPSLVDGGWHDDYRPVLEGGVCRQDVGDGLALGKHLVGYGIGTTHLEPAFHRVVISRNEQDDR